jgi:tRNA threonylcarbamoyladenosine biosynthesis protein TsaE
MAGQRARHVELDAQVVGAEGLVPPGPGELGGTADGGHVGPHVVPQRARRGRLVVTLTELVAWGEALGRAMQPPLVVALSGPLGAGKTVLVQAICRGYGVIDSVTSPTFGLVHEYAAPRSPVYHIDLYRISGPDELAALAWDEIMSAQALILVEWAERAQGRLPAGHVPLDLEYVSGDDERRYLLAG